VTAATWGQAAYGAHRASFWKRHGWDGSGPLPDGQWEAMADDGQADWEAAAQAVIDAFEEADHRQPLSVAVRALREIAWGSAPDLKPVDPSVIADKALAELRRLAVDEEAAAEWQPLRELAALRELLDEIGTLAANAPEDGDSYGLLEEIAMRIAAAGVPLEGS
jgi:hypothetical protein